MTCCEKGLGERLCVRLCELKLVETFREGLSERLCERLGERFGDMLCNRLGEILDPNML